jgi:NitT/TauT family transport system substrate-binding protein
MSDDAELYSPTLLYGSAGNVPTQARTPVRIAADIGFSYLPVFIANELGFYADESLDAVLDPVHGGGSKSMEAIVGGSVDVGGISLELGIQLAAEGRHVQSFVTLMDRPSYVLALSPASKRKVHQVQDLKGAVVGVTSPRFGVSQLRELRSRHSRRTRRLLQHCRNRA